MTLQIFGVDTMKDSRDSQSMTQANIDRHIDTVAWMHPTHITVDCFMDWPDQFRLWVNSIRRYNLPIIYRLNWWGWEYYDNPGSKDPVTPQLYISKTAQFIQDNITYFRDGDIFDCLPEIEGGKYWYTYPEPRYQDPAMIAEYNATILSMFTTFGNVFSAAGLNVIANHCSHTSGSFTNNLISAEAAAAHHWITMDSYPDYNTDDPTVAATAWLNLLQQMHTQFPDRELFITETGYKVNGTVSQKVQKAVIAAELQAFASAALPLIGMCYWVGCGYVGDIELFEDVARKNIWNEKESAKIVAAFYANKGKFGRVPVG